MRILGIDIGSTSVKAVEIISRRKQILVDEYHEKAITPGADVALVVRSLVGNLPKAPDRVVVALRTSQTTFRNLELPTKDKKAIAANVGMQLEDEVPFDVENSVYDHAILGSGPEGSQVHVAATLRRYMDASLRDWLAAGIDPDQVTTEAWAFRALFNRLEAANEQPTLLVHAGSSRTVLYVHHRGQPIVAREIPWGGRELTAALSRKYGIPYEQAEQGKLDHGFVLIEAQLAAATQEQVDFSETLMEPIQQLLQEIRAAEFACKAVTRQSLSRILMSGGTSLLTGLHRRIEEELRIPVQPLRALSALGGSAATYSEPTDAGFTLALALAVCQADRATSINLRRGDFARAGQSTQLNLASLKWPLVGASAVVLCMILSLAVRSWAYQRELKDVDAQLEKSIKTFFSQVSGSSVSTSALRNYMASTATLKSSMNKELAKLREQAKLAGPNPHSPLAFLKELSVAIPKDLTVDLVNFQVGAAPDAPYSNSETGTATLSFVMADAQAADRLASIITGKVSGLKRTGPEPVKQPDGTPGFKVTFEGKPLEEAYGK